MSKLFSKMTNDGLEKAEDRVGGNGPKLYETGLYDATVKTAYAGSAASGAQFIQLILGMPDGGEYRETVYFTNKAGENWFEKDGKKIPLPGFTLIDDLCLVTTGFPLAEQDTDERKVKVYNFDTQQEEYKSVPMLMDLLDKELRIALVKETVNKNVKGDKGYVPAANPDGTPATRDQNSLAKAIHAETNKTVPEIRKEQETGEEMEPTYAPNWAEKNTGVTRNNVKPLNAAPKGAPKAAPAAGGAAPKASGSLFGKKS